MRRYFLRLIRSQKVSAHELLVDFHEAAECHISAEFVLAELFGFAMRTGGVADGAGFETVVKMHAIFTGRE